MNTITPEQDLALGAVPVAPLKFALVPVAQIYEHGHACQSTYKNVASWPQLHCCLAGQQRRTPVSGTMAAQTDLDNRCRTGVHDLRWEGQQKRPFGRQSLSSLGSASAEQLQSDEGLQL
jgi:hypothetical protein